MKLLLSFLFLPLTMVAQSNMQYYRFHNLTQDSLLVYTIHYCHDSTKTCRQKVYLSESLKNSNSPWDYGVSDAYIRTDVMALKVGTTDTVFAKTYLPDDFEDRTLHIRMVNGERELMEPWVPENRLLFRINGFDKHKAYDYQVQVSASLRIRCKSDSLYVGKIEAVRDSFLILENKRGNRISVRYSDIQFVAMRKYVLYFPNHSFLGYRKWCEVKWCGLVSETEHFDQEKGLFWTWE